jgi:hypothetical protein
VESVPWQRRLLEACPLAEEGAAGVCPPAAGAGGPPHGVGAYLSWFVVPPPAAGAGKPPGWSRCPTCVGAGGAPLLEPETPPAAGGPPAAGAGGAPHAAGAVVATPVAIATPVLRSSPATGTRGSKKPKP